jgi:hypothetical protein
VAFRVIRPGELEWTTRDHEPEEAPRHVAELSEPAGFAHTRPNVWRYEPGAKGRHHKHMLQESAFVVLAGTLSMYLGSPPGSSKWLAAGRFVFGCPGDNGILADHRRSVGEREHRKLLLSADPLEVGALTCRPDGARAALAEDDTLVFDSRLVECLVSARAHP